MPNKKDKKEEINIFKLPDIDELNSLLEDGKAPTPKPELEPEATKFSVAEEGEDSDLMDIQFGTEQFDSDKQRRKFINSVKSIVRHSPEYKLWREYITVTLGENYCVVTGELKREVTINIHHHPFTLYEIIDNVIEEFLTEGALFTSLDVSKKVMQLHYEDKIGYVPLATTIHEKYHNGFLQIPIEVVKGNWKQLLTEYSKFMTEEEKEAIKNKTDITYETVGEVSRWTKGVYPTLEPVKDDVQNKDAAPLKNDAEDKNGTPVKE